MIKQVERTVTVQKEKKDEKKRWTAGVLAAIVLFGALRAVYIAGVRSAEVVARKR